MDWSGRTYAQRMHFDLQHPGLELHEVISRYEVTKLRRLLRSPEPEARRALEKPICGWGAPLHLAVWCDSPEAVHVLLEAGADADSDVYDDTPWVLAAKLGRREILRCFWPLIMIQWALSDCLTRASANGHVATVRDMLDRRQEWSEGENLWALKSCAAEWRDNVAELLLSRFTDPISLPSPK